MSDRRPRRADFVGKTIDRIDTRACNVWRLFFADGSAIAIEVAAVAPGVYGMLVCEECAK